MRRKSARPECFVLFKMTTGSHTHPLHMSVLFSVQLALERCCRPAVFHQLPTQPPVPQSERVAPRDNRAPGSGGVRPGARFPLRQQHGESVGRRALLDDDILDAEQRQQRHQRPVRGGLVERCRRLLRRSAR